MNSAVTAGGGVGCWALDVVRGIAAKFRRMSNDQNNVNAIDLDKAASLITELIAAAANVSERIAYYAELGENATPTIEDWAYTDQSGDVARLRTALAALEGK